MKVAKKRYHKKIPKFWRILNKKSSAEDDLAEEWHNFWKDFEIKRWPDLNDWDESINKMKVLIRRKQMTHKPVHAMSAFEQVSMQRELEDLQERIEIFYTLFAEEIEELEADGLLPKELKR